MNDDHFVNGENMDTHGMNPSSPRDNFKLVYFNLNFLIVINSPSLTQTDQECFPTVGGSFIENSCSEDYCDFLPSSNHEYLLEYILYYYILQGKNKHLNIFNSVEEINVHDIPLLSHQSTFSLEDEYHVEEECVGCETIPIMKPIDSQSSNC
jgi:hypothetical protein